MLKSIEICAGAGGQALGLEQAGFFHSGLVENDHHACKTLRINRPHWNVFEQDIRKFSAENYPGIDLLAGGLPCPPFSIAGKQLGETDDRNLFPEFIRLVEECLPKAILVENVRGLLDNKFKNFRDYFANSLLRLGYSGGWRLFNASDFGVPQLRPRVVFVAFRSLITDYFEWPVPNGAKPASVGETLLPLMSAGGWKNAEDWSKLADKIGPTLVGGSKKHGGPDLGPTRARKAWAELGVDGIGIADSPPEPDFVGSPKLTVEMTKLLQGFPPDWKITGKKTAAYRQIGNAFPPPVAKAIGESIAQTLIKWRRSIEKEDGIESEITRVFY